MPERPDGPYFEDENFHQFTCVEQTSGRVTFWQEGLFAIIADRARSLRLREARAGAASRGRRAMDLARE